MSRSFRAWGIAPPRFNTAVHVLVWLATADGIRPSAEIAAQIQAHATYLRRVLAPLVQAGIVEAREGRVGGYFLARPAESISLGEVYMALKTAPLSGPDVAPDVSLEEPDGGSRGERLEWLLDEILSGAENRAVRFLRDVTIADLAKRLES